FAGDEQERTVTRSNAKLQSAVQPSVRRRQGVAMQVNRHIRLHHAFVEAAVPMTVQTCIMWNSGLLVKRNGLGRYAAETFRSNRPANLWQLFRHRQGFHPAHAGLVERLHRLDHLLPQRLFTSSKGTDSHGNTHSSSGR